MCCTANSSEARFYSGKLSTNCTSLIFCHFSSAKNIEILKPQMKGMKAAILCLFVVTQLDIVISFKSLNLLKQLLYLADQQAYS